MERYEQNDVNFMPKIANPPNCPELRAIEIYWAIIKQKREEEEKQKNFTETSKI